MPASTPPGERKKSERGFPSKLEAITVNFLNNF